jgi:hypothetical protein
MVLLVTGGPGGPEDTHGLEEDARPLDPRTASRVARLLRWYPKDWRARYGDEFEELLASTMAGGRGGIRMRLDVVREGLSARILASGLVGTMAPPLKRARASVAEVFVGISGFLAAALVLSRYATAWRGYPISPTMQRALASELPAIEAVERAYRDHTITSAQRIAEERPLDATVQQHVRDAYGGRAFGAPVFFNQVEHLLLYAAALGLGIMLLLATASAVRSRPGAWRRLILPGAVLMAAAGFFVAGQIASRNAWTPYGFSEDIHAILQGQSWEWPSVAYTLCPTLALVFLCVGGGMVLSRAGLSANACRWVGRLAIATGACLGLALLCTLAWSFTLSSEAPGFLFWPNLGFMGRSLISVFVATLVGMAAAGSLALAGCTRCLRASSSAA